MLDAGDALFSGGQGGGDRDQAEARLILRGMAAAGTRAMAVGERDLFAGLDFLRNEAKAAGVPLLSSNLMWNGRPAFTASLREGPLGVFAVYTERDRPPAQGLLVEDPVAVATEQAQKLKADGAQLVVGIVHGNWDALRAIAQVPGVDVVIPVHEGATAPPQLLTPDAAFALSVGQRGRTLLQVQFDLAGEGRPTDAAAGKRARSELQYLEKRVADAKERAGKAATEQEKTAFARVVSQLEERLADAKARAAAAAGTDGRRRFEATLHNLGRDVPDDPALAAALAEHEAKWGKDPTSH